MFGIKIISEREYNHLIFVKANFDGTCDALREKISKETDDNYSLRRQLEEKMHEVNKLREQNSNYLREVKSLREFRRDTLEAMGKIDLAGFQLSYCTKKCKHCDNEQHDCKKYEFGKHQYCVIPK
jgi:cell division protein FtsB